VNPQEESAYRNALKSVLDLGKTCRRLEIRTEVLLEAGNVIARHLYSIDPCHPALQTWIHEASGERKYVDPTKPE